MEDRDLSALILTRPENIYYLSGYRSVGHGIAPLQCLILPLQGEPRVLARMLEEDTVKERSWTKDPRFYMDHEDPFVKLAGILAEMEVSHRGIGVETGSWYMPARSYMRLSKVLPEARLQDATGLLEELRRVKSPKELEYMRRAAKLTDLGIDRAIEVTRQGVHEYEVFAEVIGILYKHGQDDLMNTYLTVNSGTKLRAHDTYRERRIGREDQVVVELNGCCHLYSANAIVSIFTSPVRNEVRQAHKVSVRLHDECRDSVRAGISAEHIHQVADRIYRDAGFGPYFRRVGFSLGLHAQPTYFISEDFDLLKGNKRPLEAAMTLSIEPGAYKPGVGGSIVGSNVVVTYDGFEQLTTPHLDLYVK